MSLVDQARDGDDAKDLLQQHVAQLRRIRK